jgi:hypothetical protein
MLVNAREKSTKREKNNTGKCDEPKLRADQPWQHDCGGWKKQLKET